jgi:pyochelin synthetase
MVQDRSISAQNSKLSASKRELLAKLLQGEIATPNPQQAQETIPQLVPDRESRYQPFPLTEMQQAYWLGRSDVFDLGNVSMHNYIELDAVDLDIERFNCAWKRLIDHHDMLRAVVLPNGQQQILDRVPPYEIQVLDLRSRDEQTINSQIQTIRDRLSHQVLPLDRYPQFEIVATQLGDRHFRLHMSLDGWCIDYWSSIKLFQDLSQLYNQPEKPLPCLEISFRDYVLASRTLENIPIYQRSLDYWRSRIPSLPPAPELPLAKHPSAIAKPEFIRLQSALDSQTWQQLLKRAARANLTATGVLLAAYAEVLTLWSKSPKFTINIPSFNRLPFHPQVNEIVGECASFTLLEIDNTRQESFQVRAQRIQTQLWQDLEHEYVSGVRVLREWTNAQDKAARAGTMPIVFTHGPQVDDKNPTAIAFLEEQTKLVYSISQTPQVWIDNQYAVKSDGSLSINWDFVAELFPEGMVEDMFDAYCRLLNRLVSEEKIWQETSLQLVPPTQLAQRAAIDATNTPISTELLHTLFAAQVPQRPQQPAVITSSHTLTYEELSHRAHCLAQQLRQLGASPDRLVAVVMEKGWEQVVAVLGILIAGAAYVPIDPALPQERQWHLLAQGEVQLVVTRSELNEKLDYPVGIQQICIDSFNYQLPITNYPLPITHYPSPENLAYVIYTSGSTGEPKGVAIDHRGAVNTIVDINQRFSINSQDRVLALSSLSFDLSVYDIFGTLAAGGTIVIPDAAATKDPAHWVEMILRQQVTIWNSVPALMQMLVQYVSDRSECSLDSLRLVLLSGDWIPLNLPEQIRARVQEVELVSLGGATEASIWSILYPIQQVDPSWKSIPYGYPMANQQFYILNDKLEPVPVWVPGQLYIGGVGLAQGYWRNEEKTANSFITHPVTGDRLYRTGDLGRYLPDGNIEFLGREDSQVKIRGYRIELGEIETALKQHPDVKDGAIAAVGEKQGNKQLVAYLVPQEETTTLFEIEQADPSQMQSLWKSLVEVGCRQAQQTFDWVDVSTFSAYWQLLDKLYISSVRLALKKLDVFVRSHEKYSLDDLMQKCQIKPRYDKWLKRALKTLVEEGLLQQHGEVFENILPLSTEVLSTLAAGLQSEAAQKLGLTQAMTNSLLHTAHHLPDILTENLHSAQIYASEETAEIYQKLFKYCNTIASTVMRAVVQFWQPEAQLRILEVGAGIGSTTAYLLPVLPPEQTTYFYTDISNYFMQLAQQQFGAYPFLKTSLLNIEEDPQKQGYEPHSFDVVVASSVLHVVRNLEETLRYLRSLLAPNGLLLLIEETKFHRPFDLGMGLQQGFDRFEDEELRQNHPLLSREKWQQLLAAQGFENCVIFNQPNTVPEFLGFDVLLAQAPASIKRFKPNELNSFLQKKLPEYAIPCAYNLLEALPLTSNGKIDRQALSTIRLVKLDREKTFVAPQTPLEETIAAIWTGCLSIEQVGTQDNFFDLGGDSLVATQVHHKLQTTLQRDFPLVKIFEYPNISSLANYLSNEANETPVLQQGSDRGEKRKEVAQQKRRRQDKKG